MFGRLQHIHAYMYVVYVCIPFGHLQFKMPVLFHHMSSVEGKKKVE